MNGINIFYEHIFEACEQRSISVEKALLAAKSFGIDGLECDCWRLEDRNTMSLFESCGMKVSSVYMCFDFPHEEENISEKKYCGLLETAAYFGADKVLAVPGFAHKGEDAARISEKISRTLGKMCRRAGEYNITVTVEDFDDCAAPYSTIKGLEFFLENTEGLKFTFDTGNFAYSLESAEKAYGRLKPYIAHVHLKDRSYDLSRGNPDGTNAKADLSGKLMYPCEVGEGHIGIEGLVKKLISDGYSGSFSIEHFGACDQLEYMKRSAENIRKYLG